MYRISAPGQWASICQSPSAIRLLEKMTRGDFFIQPICARTRLIARYAKAKLMLFKRPKRWRDVEELVDQLIVIDGVFEKRPQQPP